MFTKDIIQMNRRTEGHVVYTDKEYVRLGESPKFPPVCYDTCIFCMQCMYPHPSVVNTKKGIFDIRRIVINCEIFEILKSS